MFMLFLLDILQKLIYFYDYVNKNNNRKTNFMYKPIRRNNSSKPLGSILLDKFSCHVNDVNLNFFFLLNFYLFLLSVISVGLVVPISMSFYLLLKFKFNLSTIYTIEIHSLPFQEFKEE